MKWRIGPLPQLVSFIVMCAVLGIWPNELLEAQSTLPSIRFVPSYGTRAPGSYPSGEWRHLLQGDGPVITNTDLVSFKVSVLDGSGRSVAGLDKSAFTILDDNSVQKITFFSDADEPLSVSIVFDVSGSMSREKIGLAHEALAPFIETSLLTDEYSFIAFNEKPQLLIDRTQDPKVLLGRLSSVVPHGSTALYDACYLGVEKLREGAYSKRVLLLISDGQDNNSHYDLGEVLHLLRESDIMLYSIGIATPIQLSGKAGSQVRRALEGLADVTGGRAFFSANAAQMSEVFDRIALELRHQYSIGYRPQNLSREGKWHRVKVKVVLPQSGAHLSVRSREGYYSAPNLR